MSVSPQSAQPRAQGAGKNEGGAYHGPFAADDAQMLRSNPPPQIIRWTAWVLIGIFISLFLAAVLIHIPETVRCSFVLVAQNGADPIQSPLLALVQAVKVTEGQEVPAGTEL